MKKQPSKSSKPRSFTAAQIARWRAELMHKGMDVNEALVAVLAGKKATLATLKMPWDKQPKEPPEKKLRRWLDQIVRAQRRLETPNFGRCQECGANLPLGALNDTPWLEICAKCAPEDE
jgi:RNA polymerase-binding transcription factor DksA